MPCFVTSGPRIQTQALQPKSMGQPTLLYCHFTGWTYFSQAQIMLVFTTRHVVRAHWSWKRLILWGKGTHMREQGLMQGIWGKSVPLKTRNEFYLTKISSKGKSYFGQEWIPPSPGYQIFPKYLLGGDVVIRVQRSNVEMAWMPSEVSL